MPKWTEIWWEASICMEGSVLSFLKAEWKVSDTGSAHWISSILLVAHQIHHIWCTVVLLTFILCIVWHCYCPCYVVFRSFRFVKGVVHVIYIVSYSEMCLSRTLNKPKTCLFWTQKLVPLRFGLDRFQCITVKLIWSKVSFGHMTSLCVHSRSMLASSVKLLAKWIKHLGTFLWCIC